MKFDFCTLLTFFFSRDSGPVVGGPDVFKKTHSGYRVIYIVDTRGLFQLLLQYIMNTSPMSATAVNHWLDKLRGLKCKNPSCLIRAATNR